MTEQLDYVGIFEEFNKRGIKYIVIGGIAVNLLGIPRMTYDVDLLLELKDVNIKKYIEFLHSLGYKSKIPVIDMFDFIKKEKREDWIKNKFMKAFNLYNAQAIVKEIDVVIDSPVDYKKALNNVVNVKFRNTVIPVIGIKDLINMKKDTGRKQDESDIRALRSIRNDKK